MRCSHLIISHVSISQFPWWVPLPGHRMVGDWTLISMLMHTGRAEDVVRNMMEDEDRER